MSESDNFHAVNSDSIISSSSTEQAELGNLRNQVSKQSDQNLNVQISNELVEKLNEKNEECEALKREVLVLTERSSLLRNLLVGSSFGVVVVLGGFFGLYVKA
ncbi:hypothetical protein Bca101_075125 [Brassica carinata]